MSRVLGDVSCDLDLKKIHYSTIDLDLDLKVKVNGRIMYFLENASPHNVLEVATSNFACA